MRSSLIFSALLFTLATLANTKSHAQHNGDAANTKGKRIQIQPQEPTTWKGNACCFTSLTASLDYNNGPASIVNNHFIDKYIIHYSRIGTTPPVIVQAYKKQGFGYVPIGNSFPINDGHKLILKDVLQDRSVVTRYPPGEYQLRIYVRCCPEAPVIINFRTINY